MSDDDGLMASQRRAREVAAAVQAQPPAATTIEQQVSDLTARVGRIEAVVEVAPAPTE